ncbi:UDP-2,3-diacylglucosamine diphosphatase [Thiomicrorhabdus hydrogeniphila]
MNSINHPASTPFTFVIADIHLQPDSNHAINQTFMHFLQQEAPKADALYILGDLFEIWVGDDVGLENYAEYISEFKKLTDSGVKIYLQYGNRDFLMRQGFFKATGIKLLKDISLNNLYGEPYLFLHGDTLCTDDTGYQRMRIILRNPLIQWILLNLCRKRRIYIGNKLRGRSSEYTKKKESQIMDVNQTAVNNLFQQFPQVTHMIHGHTHRPQHHTIEAQHKTLHRWVLGDWRPETQIIKIDKNGPELVPYSIH